MQPDLPQPGIQSAVSGPDTQPAGINPAPEPQSGAGGLTFSPDFGAPTPGVQPNTFGTNETPAPPPISAPTPEPTPAPSLTETPAPSPTSTPETTNPDMTAEKKALDEEHEKDPVVINAQNMAEILRKSLANASPEEYYGALGDVFKFASEAAKGKAEANEKAA